MPQQVINNTPVNGQTGDTPFVYTTKINANFGELYTRVTALESADQGFQPVNARLTALINGTIDNVAIGGTTASTASFTTARAASFIGPLTGSATSLAVARTIALAGDLTGSATFDGSANITITGILGNSGIAPATYGTASQVAAITFDIKGRATGASQVAIAVASTALTDSTSLGRSLITAASGTAARTAIGAAESGANSSITSLAGLTTPLSVGQGGTGATSLSGGLDGAFGTTQGTVLYRGASTWAALAPGSSGQVLTTGGSAANPSWTTQASAGAPAPSSPSSNTTLVSGDNWRDLYATGTITITAANGGAGWRTGTVLNANTVTGLITLAVPSGATLDGTTNGTTTLYPFQKARIVQTGATAYITDWIDRAPIIAALSPSAVASQLVNLPVGYTKFRVEITGMSPSASGAFLGIQFGDAGGVKSGASDYITTFLQGSSSATASQDTRSSGSIGRNLNSGGTIKALSTVVVYPGATGQYPNAIATTFKQDSSPGRVVEVLGIDYAGTTTGAMGRANSATFITSTGTISFNLTVWGEP